MKLLDFSSVFELLAAYYFAFRLEFLQSLFKTHLSNFGKEKLGEVKKKLYFVNEAEIQNVAVANHISRMYVSGLYHKIQKDLNSINLVVWSKVEKKYNPIFLAFGLYALLLLIVAGIESGCEFRLQAICEKNPTDLGCKTFLYKLSFIKCYLMTLNTIVFTILAIILITQKVTKTEYHNKNDKKNIWLHKLIRKLPHLFALASFIAISQYIHISLFLKLLLNLIFPILIFLTVDFIILIFRKQDSYSNNTKECGPSKFYQYPNGFPIVFFLLCFVVFFIGYMPINILIFNNKFQNYIQSTSLFFEYGTFLVTTSNYVFLIIITVFLPIISLYVYPIFKYLRILFYEFFFNLFAKWVSPKTILSDTLNEFNLPNPENNESVE